jgi:hypothetical protein
LTRDDLLLLAAGLRQVAEGASLAATVLEGMLVPSEEEAAADELVATAAELGRLPSSGPLRPTAFPSQPSEHGLRRWAVRSGAVLAAWPGGGCRLRLAGDQVEVVLADGAVATAVPRELMLPRG